MRLAIALVIFAAASRPAGASPAWIERDAAIVVAGSPADLGATLSAIGGLAPLHAMTIGLSRQAARAELGWDPGDPAAWKAQGFDPEVDMWLAISVDDGSARYRELSSAASWTPRTAAGAPPAFWHARAIVGVRDPARARAAISALVARLGGVQMFVKSRQGHLVIDLVRPRFAGAGAPPSAGQVRARAADPPLRRRFVHGALLGGDGLRAWIRGGALIDIGRAIQRERHIELQRDHASARGSGPWNPNPKCAELGALVNGHLFTGAALAVRPRSDGLDLEMSLVASTAAALARALPAGGAPLPPAHRLPGITGGLAARLRALDGLRALPRPPVLQSFTDALAHIRGCEQHYGWTARIFGWPHLIGLFADEIAALGPRGEAVAGGITAASLGVSRWHRDPLKLVAVIEGAIDREAAAAAESLLDLAFAGGRERGKIERWGQGRVRPYLIRRSDPLVGASLGGARGVKMARLAPGPPPPWMGRGDLLGARIDLAAAGEVLRDWFPALAVLGDARSLELGARVSGAALRARIRLRR